MTHLSTLSVMSKALLFSLDIWQKAMKNLDRRLQVMFIVASSLSNDLRNGGGGGNDSILVYLL